MTQTPSNLLWRAAIKQYDASYTLTDQELATLIAAARMAPTSYGLQPLKLVVVSDPALKTQLAAAGYNQPQFTAASHIFVFAARTELSENDVDEYMARISEQRGVPTTELTEFRNMIAGTIARMDGMAQHQWATKQAYLALGMTLAVAAANKIDTTPMEGFDADQFDQILSMPEGYHTVVVMAAGKRTKEDKYSKLPKVRKTEEDLVELRY